MHKKELAAQVAQQLEISQDKASDLVSQLFEQMTLALSRGEAVSLPGFGSFSVRHRAARTGRSPKTGEAIEIAASNTVGFKPGKALKDTVSL